MTAQKYCRVLWNGISIFKETRTQLLQLKSLPNTISSNRYYPGHQSDRGSGAGKGGGAGGSVQEAGGGMGKYAAANEEEYFYKKQKWQLKKIQDKEKKKDKRD